MTFEMSKINLIIMLTLLVCFNSPTYCGVEQDKQVQQNEAEEIFKTFESGLNSGYIEEFLELFSENVYVSIYSRRSRYYSKRQAFFVLQDFLTVHKPIGFTFSNVDTDAVYPYASGVLRYLNRGRMVSVMVFVSLRFIDGNWGVSHITISTS